MKLSEAKEKTYSNILEIIFEIPKDDGAQPLMTDIAIKYQKLFSNEDNTEILSVIADHFIGNLSRSVPMTNIMDAVATMKLGLLYAGFAYGYLYRIQEIRSKPF